MLTRRIIPCLDVKDGRVVKGIRFRELRDAGDPASMAAEYMSEGADELVFLDISASLSDRGTMLDWVGYVADRLFIPFTVGGGIVDDSHRAQGRVGTGAVGPGDAGDAGGFWRGVFVGGDPGAHDDLTSGGRLSRLEIARAEVRPADHPACDGEAREQQEGFRGLGPGHGVAE